MAPLKDVKSLLDIANTVVTKDIATICVYIDHVERNDPGQVDPQLHSSLVSHLNSVMETLPIGLLDKLIISTVQFLVKEENRCRGVRISRCYDAPGLHVALEMLPQPSTLVLDLGTLFQGARLSRRSNGLCRSALTKSLSRTSNLVKLVLQSKCSNDILQSVGSNCSQLCELYISLSELVTDSGVANIVPSTSRVYTSDHETEEASDDQTNPGCPGLVILDITKCDNISPAGVKMMLQGLHKLRRLMYSNMKGVLEKIVQDEESSEHALEPFKRIEYFDGTEYELVTEESDDIPEFDPAKWMIGPVGIEMIPKYFPNISTLKMMLSDAEVKELVVVHNLVHLELEFSDDPGTGLQNLLESHPNISNFKLLLLQVGPIQAAHLNLIAQNCVNLGFLRIIGFDIENSGLLRPSCGYFTKLTQLHLSFYDSRYGDSDDEDNLGPSHSPEMIEFFLFSGCTDLTVANIHMNVSHFLHDQYLHKLISKNPLKKLQRLGLTAPDLLPLSSDMVRWVLETLPQIKSLSTSKWSKVTHKQRKLIEKEATENNLDVVFD